MSVMGFQARLSIADVPACRRCPRPFLKDRLLPAPAWNEAPPFAIMVNISMA